MVWQPQAGLGPGLSHPGHSQQPPKSQGQGKWEGGSFSMESRCVVCKDRAGICLTSPRQPEASFNTQTEGVGQGEQAGE